MLSTLPLLLLADPATAAFDALTIDGITLRKPAAVTIEKVAGEPLIRWPVAADWIGRDLVVVEMNWTTGESVQSQQTSRPHRLVRLSDSDGDGCFDHRTVVADRLPFTAGVLVDGDTVLVSSPPEILELGDTNGDGSYDRRTVWYDGQTLTYCANDLHGPFRGRDGLIYWTKGAFDQQTYRTPDGPVTTRASHVLRRPREGGPVEIVCTMGMDNPTDIAFLPSGEPVFCGTFFHHPAGGLRDGIAIAIPGGRYGKPNDLAYPNADRGGSLARPLLKPLIELGPAAPADLCLLDDPAWASMGELDDAPGAITLACAQFNLQRVSIHQLNRDRHPSGRYDLLVGDRVDFHPVDTLVDADGSLIVLDTGGWYDLCCPSSGLKGQIAPGGIYRLSTAAMSPRSDRWDALWSSLRDCSQTALATAARDPSRPTRLAALHQAEVRSLNAPVFAKPLGGNDPVAQRLSAAWLRSLPPSARDVDAIDGPRLLDLAATADDPLLRHQATDALLAHRAITTARRSLASNDARRQLVGLAILTAADPVATEELLPLLASDPSVVTRVAELLGSPPHRTSSALHDWIDQAWMGQDTLDPLLAVSNALAATEGSDAGESVGDNEPDRSLPAAVWLTAAADGKTTERQHRFLRQLVSQTGRSAAGLPAEWAAPLADWLRTTPEKRPLLKAMSGWPTPTEPLADALRSIAADESIAARTRLLAAGAGGDAIRSEAMITLAIDRLLDGSSDQTVRSLIVSGPIDARDRERLLDAIETLPRDALSAAVPGLLRDSTSPFRDRLLRRLQENAAAATLSVEPIASIVPEAERAAWRTALTALSALPSDAANTIDELLGRLPEGDPVNGHNVFRDARVACSGCHRVGDVGGRVGPELTRIGESRTRRDLLAAIVYPSARIEQGYRSMTILTADGRILEGLVRSRSQGVVELACGVDKICRVTEDMIDQQKPSDVSLMPRGLDRQLSDAELADLLAFLQTLRNPWD